MLRHHWPAFPSISVVSFAGSCLLGAITYHPPPVHKRGNKDWTDGQQMQSITALTSVPTRRTPQNICMSLSFENDLLHHSASKNWIWCLKETSSNLWMRRLFFKLFECDFFIYMSGWDSQSVSVHIHHLQTPCWTKCSGEDSKQNFLCQLIELGEMLE